jgi:hypothetical protein
MAPSVSFGQALRDTSSASREGVRSGASECPRAHVQWTCESDERDGHKRAAGKADLSQGDGRGVEQ